MVGALALPQGTAQISDPNTPAAPAYNTGAAQIWDPNAPSAPASTPDAAQTSDPNASSAPPSTTGAAQIWNPNDPSVPASVTYEGPYTLPKIPTECTASIIPFQTDLWVHGAQLSIEDDASWMSADRTNWTFSSNTSGIVFADPYFSAGNGCHSGRPCPTVANRTEPNSFTLTTSINGKSSRDYQLVPKDCLDTDDFLYNRWRS